MRVKMCPKSPANVRHSAPKYASKCMKINKISAKMQGVAGFFDPPTLRLFANRPANLPPARGTRANSLLPANLLHQTIEILKPRILDNHPATPFVVLDPHFQSQRPLQLLLRLPHIRIERLRLRSRLLRRPALLQPWELKVMHKRLCLTNRKRKCYNLPDRCLHLLRMFQSQQNFGMAKTQNPARDLSLNAFR